MKKIIILLTLLFLTSCNNNELINSKKDKKEFIEKKENNSPYNIKKIQTYSGEVEVKEIKKEFGIYEDNEENREGYIRLNVYNFSDDKYKEFEKYKNAQKFHIEITNGKKGIEKTLSFIRDNFFKKKGKHEFILEDYEFNFTNKEIKIFSQLNITSLGFMGIGPEIDYSIKEKGNINKYKEFDKNMKYILNNSKTLNEIIVLDYKIFTKKDGKIEIKDI